MQLVVLTKKENIDELKMFKMNDIMVKMAQNREQVKQPFVKQ
jgi:hypothetical protein